MNTKKSNYKNGGVQDGSSYGQIHALKMMSSLTKTVLAIG